MKNIAFVFTRGRSGKLTELESGISLPLDFFYGMIHARSQGHQVSLYEQKKPTLTAPLHLRLVFWLQNRIFSRLLGVGFSTPFFYDALPALEKHDAYIAVADTIGLALAYFKRRGWLKGRVIFVGMGLANRLWIMRKSPLYPFFRMYARHILDHCHRLVVLGEGEKRFYENEMPELRDRLVLAPFGIDTEFWRPTSVKRRSPREKPLVLFVGNDLNRDFPLVVSIARGMPEVDFQFLSSQIRADEVSENVVLLRGSLHEKALSDENLRDLYSGCTTAIIPLQPSIQPSGQSVCLQAMACGAPVFISRTDGYWEPDAVRGGEQLVFVESREATAWIETLRKAFADEKFLLHVGGEGQKLVRDRYTAKVFADRLISLA
jgi:glycosyltransferase involved in cell wall biosynthesis